MPGLTCLLVRQTITHMKHKSEDEQAIIKIQHEWAEARMKGDSSYTRRLEAENCTVVWPDGSIANKREDLKSMTVISCSPNSKSMIYKYACMERPELWSARARSGPTRVNKIFLAGNLCGQIHL